MMSKPKSLAQFHAEYEVIMALPANEARDRKLADLMTKMEHKYHIPALQNLEWESRNRAVIALYRIISESRDL